MAITTDKARATRNIDKAGYASYAVSGTITIPKGALVCVTGSAPYAAINAVDSGVGSICVGVATETVISTVNTGSRVTVRFGHEELFTSNVDMSALIGHPAVVFDNDKVTSVSGGASDIIVGEVKAATTAADVPSTSMCWVEIGKIGVGGVT